MRKPNVWVFDLDDTIRPCVHDYAGPILDASRLIIKTLKFLAPHVIAIVNLENEIDGLRVGEVDPATGKPFKFYMERFPGSLVATYRELCIRAGVESQPEIEEELYRIGLQAFEPTLYSEESLFPDALQTLNFLQSKEDLILLLTKGDKRVQGLKLSALDAGKRFIRVRVVEDKNPDVFRETARGFEDYRLFSVGDSYNGDIAPAIEVGYRGVWIPRETWDTVGKIREIRARVDGTRCVELCSLRELIERYDEIVRGAE